MADFTIDETVDITDVVCPMTFVKAKGGHGRVRDRTGAFRTYE